MKQIDTLIEVYQKISTHYAILALTMQKLAKNQITMEEAANLQHDRLVQISQQLEWEDVVFGRSRKPEDKPAKEKA